MAQSLPRTAPEQLAYWLEQGVDKFVYVIKAKDDAPIKVGKAESVMTRTLAKAKRNGEPQVQKAQVLPLRMSALQASQAERDQDLRALQGT
jgi:hypothetical protein